VQAPLENPAEEIKRLQRCINDLVSLLTLPALWQGADPSQIVRTLLDALLGMLRLDFVYARLKDQIGETRIQMARVAHSRDAASEPQQIIDILSRWLVEDQENWPQSVRRPIGNRDITIVPLQLGLHGEIGVLVAGCQRVDFPKQTESLVLSVAANQAVIGLQEARLLSEQKRLANELDERVAQRTAQLAAANEDLKRSEQALRRSQADLADARRELQLTIDTLPALVSTYDRNGGSTFVNQTWQEYTGFRGAKSEKRSDFHPDDIDRADRAWRASLATGEPFSAEVRARRADGTYRWHSIRRVPLRDEAGTIVKWYGVGFDIEDRKVAETALQRSEAYLAEAQKLSRTGSFGWSAGSGELFWSEETFRIFGYEPTTNINIDMVLNRVHPGDLALVQRAIDRAAIDKETIDLEHRLLMPDGSVKHLHVVGHALPDESEKLQFAGAVMDITERKTAEKELRRSEQRYRHLFHHMPVALWQLNASRLLELFQQLRSEDVADLEAYFDTHPGLVQRCMEMLIVEEVNEHTVKMLGRRDPSEFVGTTIADYFPRNSPTFRRSMVSRYRGDPNYAAETKLFALDGRVIDVLYTASRVGSISEPGMSLLGVIDISERKQAEEALRWSEQRYRLLFDNLPVALWQLDAQPLVAMLRDLRAQGVNDLSAYIDDHPDFLPNVIGAQKFEEVNDYAVQLFGARDRNELLGTSPWAWLKSHDTLRRAVESRWRGEEFYQETTKLVTRDGRTIDALFATARPQTTEGLPITFVGVIDLTKQVRAEEELQRLQADFAHAARISMLGELTASIAHEVNQPLASIAAGGEASLRWLTRPTPNVEEVRELTRQMVADARRASKIVDRVRAMASRRAPEQMLLSLDDVIREALRFLRHELESRNVAALHFPALSSPKVFADRTQLQQVIVNLVVNAMQAIAQAGSRNRNIVIRTVADDFATLHCSVEDSGPGIEPQHIARLFDSFFTTKDGGMGMGLRICRSVIEAHGGCIGADNECSQGGARFFFTLPVAGTIE